MADMLPPGHIAAGALLGARRSRRHDRPLLVIGAGIVIGVLPDLDVVIPELLDRLGVKHNLDAGEHHSWATHTPLFWALVCVMVRRLARRPGAPSWAPEAASMLTRGIAVHLAQDTLANTVALLWPLRRREYGLSLDRLPGVSDHAYYLRHYPASPAAKIEALLVASAALACRRRVSTAA
jgi:hypothetical protein